MATITLRASKGSPLTNTEVDNNFTNLNNYKYESGDNIAAADLSVTGDVTLGTANVTAAGNTQGTAQAITNTYNICNSASANQGLKLPSATLGLIINVYNISGAQIKVYPASGETIDGQSADTPVDVVDDNGKEFVGTASGACRAVGSGGNNVEDFTVNGSMNLLGDVSFGVASVAAAGSTQGTATLLAETVNVVTSGANTNGVKLPAAAAGLTVIVKNTTTADLVLYPNTSDTIDGGTVNAGVALPAKTTITVTCKDAVDWVRHRPLAVYDAAGALIN